MESSPVIPLDRQGKRLSERVAAQGHMENLDGSGVPGSGVTEREFPASLGMGNQAET